MTEKFVLWNQDKARYLKKGCDMKTVNDGRAKHAKHLDEAEVFEDYDIAKEYMRALNEATKRFFYLGDPWGVINFDFTDHFCEKNAAELVEDLKDIKPKSTSLAEDAGEPEEDEATAIKPNHYAQGAGGATFDVIEALYQVLPWEQFKGYMKGNIIKYTVRYDAKNGTEDVEKAAEYNRRLMAYELREGAKNAD